MAANTALITGANGLIGQRLATDLLAKGQELVLVVRDANRLPMALRTHRSVRVVVADLSAPPTWFDQLGHIDVIFHLAGRAHILNESDPAAALSLYRAINVDASLALATTAAQAGVRRFVYVSSIKVNGEATHGNAFTADDTPAPSDPYGISKLEAEQGLTEISASTRLELCVVRPPLVYGPHVRANFARLMAWAQAGRPLPFGAVHNRRSLIGLSNLSDLLQICASHPRAAGQVFLASDDDDVSTPELIRRIAAAYARPARLIAVPPALLGGALRLLGRNAMWQRLAGSLVVDITKTRTLLGWTPPVAMHTELVQTVQASSTGASDQGTAKPT